MRNVRVVAPTSWSPRANAGFIICPPSMLPSVFPKLNRVSADFIDMIDTNKAGSRKSRTDFVDKADNATGLNRYLTAKYQYE